MSNSNTTTRNVYNSAAKPDEMAMLLNQSDAHESDETIINGNDLGPSTSQQHRHHQRLLFNARRESPTATRINIEEGDPLNVIENTIEGNNGNIESRQRARNLLTMLREARQQLHRQQSPRDHPLASNTGTAAVANNESTPSGSIARTWRNNLYDALVPPGSPRTEVLRAIFSPTSVASVRYNPLQTNENLNNSDESFHIMFNRNSLDNELQRNHQSEVVLDENSFSENSASTPISPVAGVRINDVDTPVSRRQSNGNGGGIAAGANSNVRLQTATTQSQTSIAGSTSPTVDMDDADATVMGELIVKMVTQFVRYLPFICLLLSKFIYDHFFGILDLSFLSTVVFCVNKTLKAQVAKLNQKSYTILVRETLLIIFIVTYRFLLSSTAPDPCGLLINPPGEKISMNLATTASALSTMKSNVTVNPSHVLQIMPSTLQHSNAADEVPSLEPTPVPLYSTTISLTKTVSLGVLLYYVAVNDLILKLLTQMVKISITMLPNNFMRHKSRGRLYALVEYVSQFYRAIAPMRQWLTFLFESYSGLEIISGILFASFYLGAKGFEIVERAKSSKKAIVNFVRNMDYDRKPTNDELDAAGAVCPICHDSYTTPVVLECSHIFCDECVNTWFKREQTCPMCRAEVREDPTWQDGATTFFLQLF